jgi:hypothetical protein
MRLQVRFDYPAPPEQVFATLTDPDYLTAKSKNAGDDDVTVLERGQTAEGFKMASRRTVALDVPAFARKLINPKNVLTQTDVWADPAPDGTRRGTWTAEARGVPVAMSGTMTLAPAPGGGTAGEISGEVTSSVPLVGGKLAAYVAKEAEADLHKEHDFIVRWLEERG